MYVLYEEIARKQTDTQKKKDEPLIYDVTEIDGCNSMLIANAWVNEDSLRRSWSKRD